MCWNACLKSQTKDWGPCLVDNLLKEVRRSYITQDVERWELRWLLEDVGVRENGVRTWATRKYSLAHLKIKMWTTIRVDRKQGGKGPTCALFKRIGNV